MKVLPLVGKPSVTDFAESPILLYLELLTVNFKNLTRSLRVTSSFRETAER